MIIAIVFIAGVIVGGIVLFTIRCMAITHREKQEGQG